MAQHVGSNIRPKSYEGSAVTIESMDEYQLR